MDIIASITDQFKLQRWQVENTVKLIDEGNTIPLSPVTEKRLTELLMTRLCVKFRRDFNISAILTRDVRRFQIP